MSKKGDYKIPFDKDGNPQSYPEPWGYEGKYPNVKPIGPEWRDNIPFDGTMTYAGYGRGRSSAILLFTLLGKTYPMFLSDFDACAKHMHGGVIHGRWAFTKKGMNYGLQLQA